MKKVLVLMLVLGMASLANASLILQVDGVTPVGPVVVSGPVTITIYNDGALAVPPDIGGIISDASAVALGVVASNLPGTWSQADYGFVGAGDSGLWKDGFVVAVSNDIPAVAGTAVGALFNFTVDGLGDVQMFDSNGAALGAVVTLVPEPATMLILGLGGLLLRRK